MNGDVIITILTFTLTDPLWVLNNQMAHPRSVLLLELLESLTLTLKRLTLCIKITADEIQALTYEDPESELYLGPLYVPSVLERGDGRATVASDRTGPECGNCIPDPVWL